MVTPGIKKARAIINRQLSGTASPSDIEFIEKFRTRTGGSTREGLTRFEEQRIEAIKTKQAGGSRPVVRSPGDGGLPPGATLISGRRGDIIFITKEGAKRFGQTDKGKRLKVPVRPGSTLKSGDPRLTGTQFEGLTEQQARRSFSLTPEAQRKEFGREIIDTGKAPTLDQPSQIKLPGSEQLTVSSPDEFDSITRAKISSGAFTTFGPGVLAKIKTIEDQQKVAEVFAKEQSKITIPQIGGGAIIPFVFAADDVTLTGEKTQPKKGLIDSISDKITFGISTVREKVISKVPETPVITAKQLENIGKTTGLKTTLDISRNIIDINKELERRGEKAGTIDKTLEFTTTKITGITTELPKVTKKDVAGLGFDIAVVTTGTKGVGKILTTGLKLTRVQKGLTVAERVKSGRLLGDIVGGSASLAGTVVAFEKLIGVSAESRLTPTQLTQFKTDPRSRELFLKGTQASEDVLAEKGFFERAFRSIPIFATEEQDKAFRETIKAQSGDPELLESLTTVRTGRQVGATTGIVLAEGFGNIFGGIGRFSLGALGVTSAVKKPAKFILGTIPGGIAEGVSAVRFATADLALKPGEQIQSITETTKGTTVTKTIRDIGITPKERTIATAIGGAVGGVSSATFTALIEVPLSKAVIFNVAKFKKGTKFEFVPREAAKISIKSGQTKIPILDKPSQLLTQSEELTMFSIIKQKIASVTGTGLTKAKRGSIDVLGTALDLPEPFGDLLTPPIFGDVAGVITGKRTVRTRAGTLSLIPPSAKVTITETQIKPRGFDISSIIKGKKESSTETFESVTKIPEFTTTEVATRLPTTTATTDVFNQVLPKEFIQVLTKVSSRAETATRTEVATRVFTPAIPPIIGGGIGRRATKARKGKRRGEFQPSVVGIITGQKKIARRFLTGLEVRGRA